MKLLLEKNATVHIMDVADPDEEDWEDWPRLHVHKVDVRVWVDLSDAFARIDVVDYVFANAGLGGLDDDLLVDHLDKTGSLKEPKYLEMDTNIRGVFNTSKFTSTCSGRCARRSVEQQARILTHDTVKLAWFHMMKHQRQGSIVLTCASTGYWPDYQVPVFAATAASVSL